MESNLKIGHKYNNRLGVKNKIYRLLWNIIYILFFKLSTKRDLIGYRSLLLRIFGAKVGKNNIIYPSVKIWSPKNLIIGNNSTISNGVNLYNTGPIIIGDNVIISERVFICPGSHDISDPNFPMIPSTIKIGDKVWIAAESFVGPRVTIGEGAVVGARAAVFKDVAPWSVVGGNPAVFLKKRVIKDKC